MATKAKTFRQLIEETRAGSSEAAWQLVEKYGPHVRAVVRRRLSPILRSQFDSADFAQNVWLSFFRICPRLNDIEQPGQFVALLAAMARNKVVDEVRHRSHTVIHAPAPRGTVKGYHSKDPLAPTETPSQFAVARERWFNIVDGLSETHRAVVELRICGATYREIAEKLGIHEGTARRIIARLSSVELNRSNVDIQHKE